jgi:hypothetical protein
VLFLSFRAGLDSVGVAECLGVTPCYVRQVCFRARKIAGTPAPSRRLTDEERARRKELKVARIKARAALREARRAEKAAKKKTRLCRCGQPTSSPWARYCPECKPTRQEQEANTRALRHEAGLCGSCGGERDDTAFKMCSACRERTRAATARCARKKKPV